MRNRFILTAALLVASSSIAFAQTTVNIDTFNDVQSSITRTTAGTTTALHATGSAIGGNRRASLTYNSGNTNEAATINFGGATLNYSEDASVAGSFALQYGFNLAGAPVDLSTSVVGTGAIQFERVFLDLNSTVDITIVSDRTGTPVTATISGFAIAGGGGPSSLVTIPFASFTNGGSLNLADIDQITFVFNSTQVSTDFALDNLQFTAVPEPATIGLMAGAGLVVAGGIFYRRRKMAKLAEVEVR